MAIARQTLVSRRELIRAGALLASGCAFLPCGFAGASEEQTRPAPPMLASPGRSATIGLERVITFQPKIGLFTEQFFDLSTQTDFTYIGKNPVGIGQEFSFLCDGTNALEPMQHSTCWALMRPSVQRQVTHREAAPQ